MVGDNFTKALLQKLTYVVQMFITSEFKKGTRFKVHNFDFY
jgi:hypothetical protein